MACLLTACSSTPSTPEKPPVPDGTARIQVNRPVRATERGPAPADAVVATARKAPPALSGFTLEARNVEGKAIRVSLLATLEKIARNTGLRLRDNDLPDETIALVPSDDPFDVLRQVAGKTRYRISLDRTTGRLILSNEERSAGIVVLRDTQPVQQIGAPVALPKMPEEPQPMVEALRLLAPKDFDIGYADDIDPNIRIDLSRTTNWLDGLERVALQTPYRVVFDWDKKLVYAMPVAGKPKGN